MKKYYWCTLFLVICSLRSWCQLPANASPTITIPSATDEAPAADTGYKRPSFVIKNIFISGNRKTKDYIIERELPFKRGDSVYLPDLVAGFQRARELLINTHLFNDVVVALRAFHGYDVDISIEVRERWYIFPIPYFKPVDRNLSAWQDKNYSLTRVNYGLKFSHNNFTGRNDKLRLWLITGYTRQVTINYEQPFADHELKHGFGLGMTFYGLQELNVATVNNQQFFVNADTLAKAGRFLTQNWNVSMSYFYRPAIRTRHTLRLSVNGSQVDSIVTVKNPGYFNGNKLRIFYPELAYIMEYQNVDYVPYVLRGFMGDINLMRRGVNADMNLWQLTGRFTVGFPMGHRYYLGLQGNGVIKLPLDQPYFNQRLFGYGDMYLRGLERYVVDGVAGALGRATLRKQVFSCRIPSRIPTLEHIPIKIYLKTYGDLGYSYNRTYKENSLVNTLLYTGGVGLDIVTSYDLVLRFEYDYNQLGQRGLFFHVKNDF